MGCNIRGWVCALRPGLPLSPRSVIVNVAAFAARERMPLDLIEVRHEALVEDVEGALRRICATHTKSVRE
jgi:hypothetical protein